MHRPGWMILGVGLALLAGCDPYDVLTEEGQLEVRLTSLEAPGFFGVSTERPILQGSRTTSEWRAESVSHDANASTLEACFDVTTTPDVGVLGGVLDFDQAGPVVWDFEATPCAGITSGEHIDDRLEFEVVEPVGLTASRHFAYVAHTEWLLSLERDREAYALADDGEIPDWMSPTEGPLRVLAGGRTELHGQLTDAEGRYVLVGSGVGGLELSGLDGGERDGPLLIRLDVPDAPGTTGQLDFVTPGLETSLGEVRVVSPSDIDHLEMFVLDELDPELGLRGTAGVMAVPVDAEGHRIFGAPITWSLVRGAPLPLKPPPGEPIPQPSEEPLYPINPGDCIRPSKRAGEHTSVLRARTHGHSATATLSWTVPEDAVAEDDDWVFPEECVRAGPLGCGCASTPSPAGWLAVLGLLGGLLVRRRRGR